MHSIKRFGSLTQKCLQKFFCAVRFTRSRHLDRSSSSVAQHRPLDDPLSLSSFLVRRIAFHRFTVRLILSLNNEFAADYHVTRPNWKRFADKFAFFRLLQQKTSIDLRV
jgi:hypothetical protein